MRFPIRCATRSGMAAAPASLASRASVSRKSRSLRSSASRFSASRDRSCCNIVEPVFCSLATIFFFDVFSSVYAEDDGSIVVSIIEGFVFWADAGLSPNPLPAAERVVVHDDAIFVGRFCTAGEKCEVEKALARKTPWLLLCKEGTMAKMAASVDEVTMLRVESGRKSEGWTLKSAHRILKFHEVARPPEGQMMFLF